MTRMGQGKQADHTRTIMKLRHATRHKHSVLSLVVIVAALGNFVDIYDLILFSILKKHSMMDLGTKDADLLMESSKVLNAQMVGMLLGGLLWGVLGDKRGRLAVLFGSILLYSTANFLNAYVQDVDQYVWCRFFAGLGLAGELGTGITLVSESLPREKRTTGIAIIAGMGALGVTGAFLTYRLVKDWRLCYQIGGMLGIGLLALRFRVIESRLFVQLKAKHVPRGKLSMLFADRRRLATYLLCVSAGLPNWLCTGILISQSDRFAKAIYGSDSLDVGKASMMAFSVAALGDLFVGLISQWLRSRKKAILLYFLVAILGMCIYFSPLVRSDLSMYIVCAFLGLHSGAWAVFITLAAEQYGTNLRATASTSIPNMVRGSLPLMNLLFIQLFQVKWGWGIAPAGIATCVVVMSLAFTALHLLKETYGRDLNYVEAE